MEFDVLRIKWTFTESHKISLIYTKNNTEFNGFFNGKSQNLENKQNFWTLKYFKVEFGRHV